MSQGFKSSIVGSLYADSNVWPQRRSARKQKRFRELPKPLSCDAIESYPLLNAMLRGQHLHEPEWKSPPTPPNRPLDQDRSRWMTAIEQLGKAGSLDAAKQIDAIRESVDEVSVTAESYLRAIVKGLPAIRMVERAPAWLDEPTDEYDPSAIDPRVMASAQDIVRAVLAVAPEGAVAKCEPAPEKGLEICWDTPHQLTWVIGKPRLPWPGVNVRAYARAHVDRPALDVRTFFLAHRLIEHAIPILHHGR